MIINLEIKEEIETHYGEEYFKLSLPAVPSIEPALARNRNIAYAILFRRMADRELEESRER